MKCIEHVVMMKTCSACSRIFKAYNLFGALYNLGEPNDTRETAVSGLQQIVLVAKMRSTLTNFDNKKHNV